MSVEIIEKQDGLLVVMTPNHSANWRLIKWFLASCAGLTLLVATLWAAMGVWLILPFAGLEVLLLGYCLWRVATLTHSQQTIEIQNDLLIVCKGLYHPREQWQWPVRACQFVLNQVRASEPAALAVKHDSRFVDLGGFLNPDDKRLLLNWVKHQRYVPVFTSRLTTTKM